ncbi:uncharacterized protein TA03955 [Theileria annulata]|uniref:Uncharacterized protein n=1 Tax=Theileria annulata TaxID=5874 RepID=Q4UCB4_THEAN|nr:uncharacterized protein TA03955 [Theileria annulata]CAI75537.1 hypothetical protein TA03955 [Theileria annulata]|eukprot:XP_955013.1 hypothetical protein TA03955 [Theileria annulata]
MNLSSETQYFFDLTDKQWWILSPSDEEWEELSNEEAYKLGLFKAVFSQNCNFIDTDINQYDSATSELIKTLDTKFSFHSNEVTKTSLNSTEGTKFSLDSIEGTKLVENKLNVQVPKVLTKDFSNLETQNLKHNFKNVKYSDPKYSEVKSSEVNSEEKNMEVNPEVNPEVNMEGLTGSKILNQINNLIASTSEMKQKCEAREMSGKSTPNLRSTARHLTYVNNGGLAGCLKTVAEERKKIVQSKKNTKAQNPQLQEMIQRAKAMAVKSMDDAKDSEAKSDKNQQQKTQVRSRAKKYTTVFGTNAMKDLSQKLPDVTFEGSSEEESDV